MKKTAKVLSVLLALVCASAVLCVPAMAGMGDGLHFFPGSQTAASTGAYTAADLAKALDVPITGPVDRTLTNYAKPAKADLGIYYAAAADLDGDGKRELLAFYGDADGYLNVAVADNDESRDSCLISTCVTPVILWSEALSAHISVYIIGNEIYIDSGYASGIQGSGSHHGEAICVLRYKRGITAAKAFRLTFSAGTMVFRDFLTDREFNSRQSGIDKVDSLWTQYSNEVKGLSGKANAMTSVLETVFMIENPNGKRSFKVNVSGGKPVGTMSIIKEGYMYANAVCTKPGDANGDDRVTAADARIALRASARLETLSDSAIKCCDLNGDGKVSAAEARTILRFSAGLVAAL